MHRCLGNSKQCVAKETLYMCCQGNMVLGLLPRKHCNGRITEADQCTCDGSVWQRYCGADLGVLSKSQNSIVVKDCSGVPKWTEINENDGGLRSKLRNACQKM